MSNLAADLEPVRPDVELQYATSLDSRQHTPLSPRERFLVYLEYICVIAITVGPIWTWTDTIVWKPESFEALTNDYVRTSLPYYAIALFVLYGISRVRDWSFSGIGWKLTPALAWIGFGIYGLEAACWMLMDKVGGPDFIKATWTSPKEDVTADLFHQFVFSIANPLFEETIVVGYTTYRLRKVQPLWACGIVSVILRLSYHLYQGVFNTLTLLPMAVVFFLVYTRYRSLWPLLIAHGLMNLSE